MQSKNSRSSPLFTITCLTVVIWGVAEARNFLIPLLIAGVFAFLMMPLHGFLQRKLKFPDLLAVITSVFISLIPLTIFSLLLFKQVRHLIQDFPVLLAAARLKLDGLANSPLLNDLGFQGDFGFDQLVQKFSNSLGQSFSVLLGSLAMLAGMGSQILLIFVFAILMLASRLHLRHSFENILAQYDSIDGADLITQSATMVKQFLVARMTIVFIVSLVASFLLRILGMNYSLFLGTLFGLSTLVPAIGSISAMAITVITAFITGQTLGSTLLILGALGGVSLLENYVLTPKLVGNRLNLNALTTFIGLFAGGLLWGVWGMFLSVPILGILRIVFSAFPTLQPWGDLLSGNKKDI